MLRDAPIVAFADLDSLGLRLRTEGRTVVWTNGCFDLIHAGHLRSLSAARALGDVLMVGINTDNSVRRLKGIGRPIMPETERAALVAGLRWVDFVTIFDEATPAECIRRLRPAVHCKGADYAPPFGKPVPEAAVVESYGGRVAYLPLLEGHSTSELIHRIQRSTS